MEAASPPDRTHPMNPKLEIKIPRVIDGDRVVGVIICGEERHKCKNRIEDILSGRFRDPPKNEDSDEEPDHWEKSDSAHHDGSNSGVRSGSTGMHVLSFKGSE